MGPRLWVFSDLHVDINRAYPLDLREPRPAHDVVVIAGDIGEGLADGVDWIAAHGLNRVPVVYVGGNHEFYGHDRHEELERGRLYASGHDNIHLLECDEAVICGVRFLGCTLWTDYALYGDAEQAMRDAGKLLSDHMMIQNGGRTWTPMDARAEHLQSRAWLKKRLAEPFEGPTVVVTHHAPSERSVDPRFRDNRLTPAFCSDVDDLVARADLWVHGHTHASFGYRLGKCRVVNNPRGYLRREKTGFRSDFVVELD